MNDNQLSELLTLRNDAWDRTKNFITPLRNLAPEQRKVADGLSETYRNSNAAIVAELVERDRPVVVESKDGKTVYLYLTWDKLHFAECDPITRKPIYVNRCEVDRYQGLLYRYPEVSVAGRHHSR